MILSVTGHRPDKLGGYSEQNRIELVDFAKKQLTKFRPSMVLCGMAIGWDLAIAEAAASLAIPFVACVPCEGQASKWPQESRARYDSLIKRAADVAMMPGGPYSAWKMQARNMYMVDRSNRLLALWNGSAGGTKNCVDYAIKVDRDWSNCWDEWKTRFV